MQLLMISSESRPEVAVGVLLHLAHDQFLIERAAVDADAHRLAVIDGHFADGGKLLVAPGARAHVAGIDAVFIQGRAQSGYFVSRTCPL